VTEPAFKKNSCWSRRAFMGGIAAAGAAVYVRPLTAWSEPIMSQISFEPLDPAVREAFREGRSAPHVLTDFAEGYRTWCNSVIRWTDGSYHAYYARWPVATGHNGWLTHCEIAHGVSDKPEGPFVYQRTVIASRNPGDWDVMNAHNPCAIVAEGKVCLYYITNRLADIADPETGDLPRGTPWMVMRNSQVTTVAIADDPNGAFTRAREPVVVPHGGFRNIAVNPAVVYRDGRYLMIIKGDDANRETRYPKVHRSQFVGVSTRPEGPFTFQETPVYDRRTTEDATIWYEEATGLYNVVVHVGWKDILIRLVSRDGLSWEPADPVVFMRKEFAMSDGSIWKPYRVERPFMLLDERGRPEMLYVAIMEERGGKEANIALRVRQ
jgi:hypothetical protein